MLKPKAVIIEDDEIGFVDAIAIDEWEAATPEEQDVLMEQRRQVMLDAIQYAQDHPEPDTPPEE